MSQFADQLKRLIGAVDVGVLDPTQGYSALEQLVGSRADARKTRREDERALAYEAQQAQQDALSGLMTGAHEAATKGASYESLLSDPTMAGIQQIPADYLSTMFHAPDNPESRNYGISKINPTLDSADVQQITADFYGAVDPNQPDLETARRTIQNNAATAYGPKVYAQMRPQIDELINELFKNTFGNAP